MNVIEPICPWEDARQIGDCTLYLGDCLRVMPFLEGVDAVVTDPPYGIGADAAQRLLPSREKKLNPAARRAEDGRITGKQIGINPGHLRMPF